MPETTLENIPLVSADSHVSEPVDLFLELAVGESAVEKDDGGRIAMGTCAPFENPWQRNLLELDVGGHPAVIGPVPDAWLHAVSVSPEMGWAQV